jgi:hypothetical protein
MSDIRGLLQKNSGALQMVRQESHRLRSTHPKVNAPESIFESPFDDLASLDTTLTPTAFTFDDDVINSKAYRMALTKPTSQRKDLSSTDLGAPGTESDQRNAVLRSLLREREDESIRLREQIETLSRSNSSLSARLKENEERYSAKSAETTRRIAEIEKMRSEIEMASKREAKINTSLQKMEKAFSKKGKTSIFSLSRDAPDAEPRRPSPKIWVFAGVNNADNAVQICIKKGIIKEGISDEDDMIIIFMNEESLAETKNDMGRELLAIYESRKSLGSYNQHIQEEQLALVIGEKSAKHLSDEYVNLLLVTLMMYTTVIVFW